MKCVPEEVEEVVSGDETVGIAVNALESSIWFKVGLFSKYLTDDFDLFFAFRDGLEEVGELVLGLKTGH